MKYLHKIAYILLWIGGFNWGLVGLFNYNLVESLFGSWPTLIKLIYILVGVSAAYLLIMHKSYCEYCKGKKR